MDTAERSSARALDSLHDMAANGDTEKVRTILNEHTDGGLLDRGGPGNNTALHLAIWYGHKDTAKALVKRGAKLTILRKKALH